MKKYEEGVYTTVQLQTYFGCLPVWYYTQYLSAIVLPEFEGEKLISEMDFHLAMQ
jgi:hypothetical protein